MDQENTTEDKSATVKNQFEKLITSARVATSPQEKLLAKLEGVQFLALVQDDAVDVPVDIFDLDIVKNDPEVRKLIALSLAVMLIQV